MTRGVGGQSPANLQKYLRDVGYPASKDDLLEQARRNEAPKEILETIQRLPEDQFGGPQDVMKGYGQIE
ncbi:DUF2795 domain-containing protein [Dyella sp.]|uniref:DUF2795 domain-containing protein n=1 Tax=Dyella sp. TaxID=1869338 RepID=UPI002D798678|nr:DUF2795 domain-containing protein [Dyella sp.]HET7332624.1 DUF2795 domain-containing protein [Dyella sp.]